jgi:hypothetical protein
LPSPYSYPQVMSWRNEFVTHFLSGDQ